MGQASWTLLSLSWLSLVLAVIGTNIEVQQFPDVNTVDIKENSSAVLRFHITATSLESVSIVYRTNASRRNNLPATSFNYRALHSAIIAPCHTDDRHECYELYIRVQGDQRVHNTTFHLVLIEMRQQNVFTPMNVTNSFTVQIAKDSAPTGTPSDHAPNHTTPNETPAATSTRPIPTAPSPEPSTDVQSQRGDTTESRVGTFTGHQQNGDHNELTLIIALAVVLAALLLSCTLNMLLCCLARKLKKSQAASLNVAV